MVPIEDASGLLGSIFLTLPPGRDIRPLEHRLLSDIAEQAALALSNVRLELELAERVRQLDRHTRELAASRNRIMGAVDTERRRLESSIAGRVLPTMVRLRAEVAQTATDGARAEGIEECLALATEAVESLRELTRGIYPTNLTRSGLGSALPSRAAAMRRADAVRIDPAVATARFPEHVEAAAYYCCVEVLEHPAGEVSLTLDESGDLVLAIRGVDVEALNRLAIVDRIEACGGALHVPDPESGNALQIRFPAARCLLPGLLGASIRPHLQQACRAECGLGDVRRRTAPGQVEVVLVVGGEQDDDRRRGDLPDLACGLDPVDAREVDVHQDQVWLELGRRRDRLLTRCDSPDDREALGRFHDDRHRAPERVLVVDDQHLYLGARDFGHGSMVSGAPLAPQGVIRTIRGGCPSACWFGESVPHVVRAMFPERPASWSNPFVVHASDLLLQRQWTRLRAWLEDNRVLSHAGEPSGLVGWTVGDLVAHLGLGLRLVHGITEAPEGTVPISLREYVAAYPPGAAGIAEQTHEIAGELAPDVLAGLDVVAEDVLRGARPDREPGRACAPRADQARRLRADPADRARRARRRPGPGAWRVPDHPGEPQALAAVAEALATAYQKATGHRPDVNGPLSWIRLAAGRMPSDDPALPLF